MTSELYVALTVIGLVSIFGLLYYITKKYPKEFDDLHEKTQKVSWKIISPKLKWTVLDCPIETI